MAERSWAGGVVALYGVAIGNALSARGTSTNDLVALRGQVKMIVDAQGDLVTALKELDAEIGRRKDAAPASALPQERFIAQIEGVVLSDDLKMELEQSIKDAVMSELGKLDMHGDLVATPLSASKDILGGLGAHDWTVAGMFIQSR
jgi:hypothetical protein